MTLKPPDLPPYGDHWERIPDPWHTDAFPDEFKKQAPHKGKRKMGWGLFDWCGNLIGWIPFLKKTK